MLHYSSCCDRESMSSWRWLRNWVEAATCRIGVSRGGDRLVSGPLPLCLWFSLPVLDRGGLFNFIRNVFLWFNRGWYLSNPISNCYVPLLCALFFSFHTPDNHYFIINLTLNLGMINEPRVLHTQLLCKIQNTTSNFYPSIVVINGQDFFFWNLDRSNTSGRSKLVARSTQWLCM